MCAWSVVYVQPSDVAGDILETSVHVKPNTFICLLHLKTEIVCSSKMLVTIYKTTWCHSLEDHSIS
jgi:hypothetical protein